MKKCLYSFVAAILVVVSLCGLLSGCANNRSDEEKMVFSDSGALADYAQNTYWVSQPEYANTAQFILCCFTDDRCIKFDLSREPGVSLAAMFGRMLQQTGHASDYEDVYDFLRSVPSVDGLTYTAEEIWYDPTEGSAHSASGTSVWKFYRDNTMKHHGDSYIQTEHLLILEYAFNEAYQNIKSAAQEAFLSKYPDAASHKDVKYDPYAYLGKDFIITGTAELDDYYNYEYRDWEYSYFCIDIEPANGSYSDRWYIYANRNTFQELFQILKNGNGTTVTLVCRGQFVNATKNSLATLVDYSIS